MPRFTATVSPNLSGSKYRFSKNVREWRFSGDSPFSISHDRLRRELAVIEPFHGFGVSDKLPAIEEHFLACVECHSLKHL